MSFEWDEFKADLNYKKHGIRFSEAASVWLDESSLEMQDLLHSDNEERWIRLGFSRKANLLVVVYCEKSENEQIRIISARAATTNESKHYHAR